MTVDRGGPLSRPKEPQPKVCRGFGATARTLTQSDGRTGWERPHGALGQVLSSPLSATIAIGPNNTPALSIYPPSLPPSRRLFFSIYSSSHRANETAGIRYVGSVHPPHRLIAKVTAPPHDRPPRSTGNPREVREYLDSDTILKGL